MKKRPVRGSIENWGRFYSLFIPTLCLMSYEYDLLSCVFSSMRVAFSTPLVLTARILVKCCTLCDAHLYFCGMIERDFLDSDSSVILMFTLQRSALRAGHAFRPTFQARLASTSSPSPQNTLKKGLYTTLVAVSTGLFAVYYFDSRSAIHRYIITPAIRYSLDPETAHRVAVRALASGFGPRDTQVDDERLKLEVIHESHCFGTTR